MTELEKYGQRRAYTISHAKLVEGQKLILADLLEKQNNYLSTCPHRFVLYLGDIELLECEESVYVCLGCDKPLILNKGNVSYNDKKIDISQFVEPSTIYSIMIKPSNTLILKVRETLDKLVEEEKKAGLEYDFLFIKERILTALSEYKESLTTNNVEEIKLNRAKKD